jgi:hypothetical protein
MTVCVILHNMIIENERDFTWSFPIAMLVAVLNKQEIQTGLAMSTIGRCMARGWQVVFFFIHLISH